MDNAQIKKILLETKTIAVVGLSANEEKDSYWVCQYIQEQGYRIIPVNPRTPEILGEKAYASLLDISEKVDMVLLFRPSADVPPFIPQAIRIGAKVVWMQTGIANRAAEREARAAGLQVVMDTCIRVAHQFLIGARG